MGKILMPRLSDTMESGTIATWHKQAGDLVTAGEILADIETDKAVMEYEAYETGVLSRILVAEGEEARIGDPIALIGDDQADVDVDVEAEVDGGTGTAATDGAPVVAAPPAAGRERVPASPLARRDARELGVDLATIRGSGSGGRVIRADVLAAANSAARPDATPAQDSAPVVERSRPSTPQGEAHVENVPLGGLRKTSGRRLAESARTAPHFYLTAVADVEELVRLRAELNARLTAAGRQKVSVNDLVVRACALVLRKHPDVNASLDGDVVRRYREVNVGVAVALEDGLLVPVVRNADRKSVGAIAEEAATLAARARERRLTADEMSGGTFTVSNLGMYGVEQFTAIINPPESAILAVGASKREAVVAEDGSIVARTRMRYTLSADHRILDGAVGARFLADLTELLEDPWLILA
ncbi:dihydrolipoamide acetyltransferase family protein [Kribbella sp. NPDC048915]|uniref:dihydrolipoamide acetyltransferase family protein n=1 Tax=Kribbella sp. NPDC048915 TaxID=3155148 RepID=UPI0033CCAECD